ncbi:hypothetical protein [Gemmatimonas sp.]|jgi:hypothetical protein|uniref:hypothetical protein n=1 Tax=Gemmatimonas sp. TaxID=1962908 RepID=UPI0037BE5F14
MRAPNEDGRIVRRVALMAVLVGLAMVLRPATASAQSNSAELPTAEPTATNVRPSLFPMFNRITPAFSTTSRSLFRRRGPRGAKYDYASQTVWLAANVHDMLPRAAAPYWPSALRVSGGRRGMGAGVPAEYVVGLDLDASRLPGNHPVWVRAKQLLHAVRLPGPALVMGPGRTRAMALYW